MLTATEIVDSAHENALAIMIIAFNCYVFFVFKHFVVDGEVKYFDLMYCPELIKALNLFTC